MTVGSGIAVTAGALPQEGGTTTTGLEGLGLLGPRGCGLCSCGEDTDLVLPALGGFPGGHRRRAPGVCHGLVPAGGVPPGLQP